jgi:hypothetical protein
MKQYDCVWKFGNDYAVVRLNGKFGVINEYGQEICEIKYEYIYDTGHHDLYIVKLNKKWGFINETGKEICEIKYNSNELGYILDKYIKNKNRNLKLNILL